MGEREKRKGGREARESLGSIGGKGRKKLVVATSSLWGAFSFFLLVAVLEDTGCSAGQFFPSSL